MFLLQVYGLHTTLLETVFAVFTIVEHHAVLRSVEQSEITRHRSKELGTSFVGHPVLSLSDSKERSLPRVQASLSSALYDQPPKTVGTGTNHS